MARSIGRDFRIISRVAPFVLDDLVPEPGFKAWIGLSLLIPLVFQPVIYDLKSHIVCSPLIYWYSLLYKIFLQKKLEDAINYFLDSTASWTTRWFNKPKFHLLLHLLSHVSCFGPAILFATEVFEAYNSLIRDLSIHSNCQAPSRDIRRGFAQANRILHMLSGGMFPKTDPDSKHCEEHSFDYSSATFSDLRTIGPLVNELVDSDQEIQKLCGFETKHHGELSLSQTMLY